MDKNPNKQPRSSGDSGYGYGGGYGQGYGYGYGGYGYGYGSQGRNEGGMQRNLQDYLLILRERIWYIIVVFLVVFSSALIYTLNQPKIYLGRESLEIKKHVVNPTGYNTAAQAEPVSSPEELNTIVKIIQTSDVRDKVAAELKANGQDLKDFMAPFLKGEPTDPTGPEGPLLQGLSVSNERLTMIVDLDFRHPVPAIAAKVANLYGQEYLHYREDLKNKRGIAATQDLQVQAADWQKKVEDLTAQVNDFVIKNGEAVKSKNDPFQVRLAALNQDKTVAQSALDTETNNLKSVQDKLKTYENLPPLEQKKHLVELPIIYGAPRVSEYISDIATLETKIKGLEVEFLPEYKDVVEAQKTLDQTEAEFSNAIDQAVELVKTNVTTAEEKLASIETELKKTTEDSSNIERLQSQYEDLYEQKKHADDFLATLHERIAEEVINIGMNDDSIDKIQEAVEPGPSNYVSPSYTFNLGVGAFLGLGLGLAFALFVAYIDDRVKSSFDIESVVGLPLIGIIPQIKKMEQPDKAQIVANNADRQVSEAFLALHSGLRLKDESKNGQCMLITSTIPGEGKSFVTTNLALTFAAHGEKVVVVDCDLRKPNVHKSFRIENLKGLIDIIAGTAAIDDVAVKGLHPNLDVIPSGGRAKNPTQILNSKKFEVFVSDLRKKYDRVFFDTPPLAAVSDALILLPLCDGSIFTIFFNKVRRKAAQFAAKKLIEANVPVYGAILNGLNLTVSGYYYAQYYDKSYKDYYVVTNKEKGGKAGQPADR
jgi:succinoglycan biosynthesis transport protein ExoP